MRACLAGTKLIDAAERKRLVDGGKAAIDPFGHVGEEHLSLLVGHPVVVLRGLVRVEVAEPVAPGLVTGLRVPVRRYDIAGESGDPIDPT